jgi:hypothetical protein
MDPRTFAQMRAIERLRDQRKRNRTNAIYCIRSLVEDDKVDVETAVNVTALVYQLGLTERAQIMEEARKKYAVAS